jgi:tryptophan synthase beta chain
VKRFGIYGGQYVSEMIMPALEELEEAYARASEDGKFQERLDRILGEYGGRPTPLTFVGNLSGEWGTKVYLKREDLLHGGAHKLNNTIGQILLAESMGKRRIIAETGAGQHGIATAMAASRLGLECVIYMGSEDVRRQAMNVFRMRLCGAKVVEVESGSRTLKDAINEAMRDWAANIDDTFYVLGSVVGPHPYPTIVRDFQRVIGREAKAQMASVEGRLPDKVVACVGGGSNASGIFYDFVGEDVELYGVEAGGLGLDSKHCATLCAGTMGVLHGAMSYLLQDEHGQVSETHSISAGLDYPGVGPEHAYWRDSDIVRYAYVTDEEALDATVKLSRIEGIIPALESAHALAFAKTLSREMGDDEILLVNLSGRGDKDLGTIFDTLGGEV